MTARTKTTEWQVAVGETVVVVQDALPWQVPDDDPRAWWRMVTVPGGRKTMVGGHGEAMKLAAEWAEQFERARILQATADDTRNQVHGAINAVPYPRVSEQAAPPGTTKTP